MISWVGSLAEMRERIDYHIGCLGPDAPIGVMERPEPPGVPNRAGARIAPVQMEWVVIDGDGTVVGDEANDDERDLKPGQRNAVMLTPG